MDGALLPHPTHWTTSLGELRDEAFSVNLLRELFGLAGCPQFMATNDSDLEASLFLNVIVAHMAFLEAADVRTRSERHNSFVEAIKLLYEFQQHSIRSPLSLDQIF